MVFFLQAEDGIRDRNVTGVQTCALPISMAAPMLAGSLTPLSITLPMVTADTTGPFSPWEESTTAPAAVAVHWAVGGRWQPYSRGVRYCRSAEPKWEEVMAAAWWPQPPERSREASARLSPMVEQAP